MESVIINKLYPEQFYRFGQESEGSEIVSDEYINSEVQKILAELKTRDDIFNVIHAIGNIYIHVTVINNTPDEQIYRVVVAKNYESAYVDHNLKVMND